MLLQSAKAGAVDIQAGHVGDGESAEERQSVPECRAYDDVDGFRSRNALLDQIDGLFEQDVLVCMARTAPPWTFRT